MTTTTCYSWTTAWPHAIKNINELPLTTDDKAKVTCPACLHALGTQKHEPPTTARKAAALMGVLSEDAEAHPKHPGLYYATVTRDEGQPDLVLEIFNPWGRGLGLFVIQDASEVIPTVKMALRHSGVDVDNDEWSMQIDYEGMSKTEGAVRRLDRTDFARPVEAPGMSPHEELARTIVSDIRFSIFNAEIWVACERDRTDPDGRLYYQVHAMRPDTYTGEMGEGFGGKAYLSPHMIEDELVQLGWGLLQSYVTHEAREGFTYKGKRIFGPHLKIANLLEIADDTVTREAS